MNQKSRSSNNKNRVSASTGKGKFVKPGTKRAWRRIALFVGIAIFAALVGAFVWWRVASPAGNQTIYKIQSSVPAPAEFMDNNVMSFMATNNIPDINNNREMNRPQPLIITYDLQSGPYQGAFKMNLTNADIARGIKISPFIKGTWAQRGQNRIVFTPESDWPADKKFTVKINPDILNPDIVADSHSVSFTTPAIAAKIESFNTYPAAGNKKSVIAIAVVSFNYPIDTHDLADKISMKLDDSKLEFAVKADKFNRTIFITSAPIAITDTAAVVRMKLNRIPALHGNSSTKKLTAHATIESADNIFKVSSIATTVADDNDGAIQQLILLNMTAAAQNGTKWTEYVHAYLLPTYKTDSERDDARPHKWAADEISNDVLKNSKKLALTPVDFVNPNGVYQYAFSYDVSDKNDRFIYVSVDGGIKSASGFDLKNGTTKVMPVPYPAPEVKIAGTGALLSLAGDKKLGIMARGGVQNAYVNLYKVKSTEINHLISQVYNVFASNIEFKSWSFGVYDMSVVFQKRISFANPSMKRTNYASVNLGDYLDRTGNDKTGIFIIQTGASESAANYNDKRLILLTDMGIIRKVNYDQSSSVFVARLSDGHPAGDVEISVLGRNGNAIWTGRTDANGRADIPKLAWSEYKNAREPIAIVVRDDDDVSFIPYNEYSLRTDYSKFATDGVYSYATNPLNAFIFSDRGIYRPGERAIIAGIVKNKSFKSIAGVPVKMEIDDARGRTTLEKTFSLTADGMFEIKYDIADTAPTGEYTIRVFSLNSKNKPQDMLGTATFRVEEFVPDTLKITASVAGASDTGWISPDNMTANVGLRNLFGTPAANRKISARAVLRPTNFTFEQYGDYIFSGNFIPDTGLAKNTARGAQTFTAQLPDAHTNDDGAATLDIKFDRDIPDGTYVLSLNIRGYEGDSGKSVQTNITTRTSSAKYLIGYRANSDLSYVNRDAARNINIIAVDHTGAKTAATDLTLRLIKRENLTSLVKDYNNYYKYQTVSRDKIVSQEKINIPQNGRDIKLDTHDTGTYFLQILDASDKILTNVAYFVAGDKNVSLQSDTMAEMQIKLNATQYAPGDDIAINITAPYAGSGLITIERDRVYAYRWFKTDKTSSVQHITVPAGFEGTGYVNVSFVRATTSRDIFTTPYAYAVEPFSADISAHKIGVKLSAPRTITNNKLTVEYKTDKSARMMIFAVNTGILQVAKYQIPNPLAHFFKKAALQVDTYQILSLLLPEYKILHEFAKTGGGDYDDAGGAANQIISNPFGRKSLPPVAFATGVINTVAGEPGQYTFDIPEYFNGDISVYAVAANDTAVGAADVNTKIQSPIIISATAPLAVAPNDTFDINAVITNMTGSDDALRTIVSVHASDNIKIANTDAPEFTLENGAEKLLTFTANAGAVPGNGEIIIATKMTDKNNNVVATRQNRTTLSVRPATTFTTKIRSGIINKKSEKITDFQSDMYPQHATRQLYVSRTPSALIKPLFEYLAHYDFPCTEQLVSRAMPYVLMPNDAALGTKFDASEKIIANTINTLKNRQNDDGSFDLWAGGTMARDNAANPDAAQITAYVVQFLTLARKNGFSVPNDMIGRGVDFLRDFAGGNIRDDAYANAVSNAIYVITQNDYVSTSYIDLFEEYANKNIKNWESGLAGAYIAASYKILKQDDKADKLIAKYRPNTDDKFVYYSQFGNNVANNAMYHYLAHRYFDAPLPAVDLATRTYINGGNYSSFTSAAVIMSLAEQDATPEFADSVSITANGSGISGDAKSGMYVGNISPSATRIDIDCPTCKDTNMYYSVIEQGYPTTTKPESNGIEIVREYYDQNGNRITSATVGDTITVKIFVRTRGKTEYVQDAAIVDLLPGGFIPDGDTITGNPEFYEIREDRVVIFANLTRTEQVFTYTAQLGAAGRFAIPAITATAMNNPQINATGDTGTFTVSNNATK